MLAAARRKSASAPPWALHCSHRRRIGLSRSAYYSLGSPELLARCKYVVHAVARPWLTCGSDSVKATANTAKHGVSFAEAQTVFLDERAWLIDDPEHSHEEARFLLLGLSVRLRVLVVVHAYREATGVIRIISARRATPRERQQYVQGDSR